MNGLQEMRGNGAIELMVWAPLLFLIGCVLIDLGLLHLARSEVRRALRKELVLSGFRASDIPRDRREDPAALLMLHAAGLERELRTNGLFDRSTVELESGFLTLRFDARSGALREHSVSSVHGEFGPSGQRQSDALAALIRDTIEDAARVSPSPLASSYLAFDEAGNSFQRFEREHRLAFIEARALLSRSKQLGAAALLGIKGEIIEPILFVPRMMQPAPGNGALDPAR